LNASIVRNAVQSIESVYRLGRSLQADVLIGDGTDDCFNACTSLREIGGQALKWFLCNIQKDKIITISRKAASDCLANSHSCTRNKRYCHLCSPKPRNILI